jgi:predicted glycosyltransferase
MNVLFYLGHPAHFHLFKNTIHHLNSKGIEATVCIKTKDVLEQLLKENNISYINISDSYDRSKALKNFASRLWKLSAIIREGKPQLLLGSAAELAVLGKFHRIPSYVFFEDDFEAVKKFAKIAGPFADHLVCPECCSAWKWERKKIAYPSYHELAYLHPDHFFPDKEKVKNIFDLNQKNFILRFAELSAYHDEGKSGINTSVARRLVEMLKPHGNIFITSERKLESEFEKYRISIPASEIHNALYFADMYIGDSQTMTAEAAVLGTPAVRFNDFVGKLSYLEELEHKFNLTYGIKTSDSDKLFKTVKTLLDTPDLKARWALRRKEMLKQRINSAEFMNKLVDKNLRIV